MIEHLFGMQKIPVSVLSISSLKDQVIGKAGCWTRWATDLIQEGSSSYVLRTLTWIKGHPPLDQTSGPHKIQGLSQLKATSYACLNDICFGIYALLFFAVGAQSRLPHPPFYPPCEVG